MKMEAPKMDLVRFKEADVIAASNLTTYVYGFNNETPSDAYVKYKGVTYTDASSLNGALAADGMEGKYQAYLDGQSYHIVYPATDMFDLDKNFGTVNDHSIIVSDGVYVWNGEFFAHQ